MRKFLTLSVAASVLALAGCAQADPDKAEIEEIVRAYLLENPEILRDMSIALSEKDAAREEQMTVELIKENETRIKRDPRDIAVGPTDAKVTIVEFFDYNCGYCKTSTGWVRDVMEEHGDDVRIVFKEVPVLDRGRENGSSRNAAKAALAAARQGQYTKMHFSLMNERALTPERVEKLAEAAGLDMDKFREAMEDPALDVHINQNLQLAREIPAMSGTPFFIVNDQYVSGAKVDELRDILAEELGDS
jgi:protein-disulfide isomerase